MSGGLFHHKTCDTKHRLTGKTCLFIDDYIQTLFVVFTTWKRLLKNEEEEEEEEHIESSFFDRSYKNNMVFL